MPDEQSTNRQLATEIVIAYVRRNQIGSDQLGTLISTVHEALGRLSASSGEPVVELTPAVPVRRSVHRDFVVCMECGWKGNMVRLHLAAGSCLALHLNLARWALPWGPPMT